MKQTTIPCPLLPSYHCLQVIETLAVTLHSHVLTLCQSGRQSTCSVTNPHSLRSCLVTLRINRQPVPGRRNSRSTHALRYRLQYENQHPVIETTTLTRFGTYQFRAASYLRYVMQVHAVALSLYPLELLGRRVHRSSLLRARLANYKYYITLQQLFKNRGWQGNTWTHVYVVGNAEQDAPGGIPQFRFRKKTHPFFPGRHGAIFQNLRTTVYSWGGVCVFSSHSFWTSSSLDVPAGVTQEEGHTGFLIHLLSAVRALIFLARRIQPSLSLVNRKVECFVYGIFSFSF